MGGARNLSEFALQNRQSVFRPALAPSITGLISVPFCCLIPWRLSVCSCENAMRSHTGFHRDGTSPCFTCLCPGSICPNRWIGRLEFPDTHRRIHQQRLSDPTDCTSCQSFRIFGIFNFMGLRNSGVTTLPFETMRGGAPV